MNTGNALVFFLLSIIVTSIPVSVQASKDGRRAILLFLLDIIVTLIAFVFGFFIAFGCFGKSSCNSAIETMPLWFGGIVFILLTTVIGKSIYNVLGKSSTRVLKEAVMPIVAVIGFSVMIGIIAGILTA